MKRFKNILYHADGEYPSEKSLQRAIHLAQSNDARLTVMDVIPNEESDPDFKRRFGVDLTELLHDRRMQQIDELLEAHNTEGVPIYTQVAIGTGFVELIRSVLRNRFDLLVKAPHPTPGFAERLLYGSFDLHLLRKCPCPVWIDRPESKHPYQNIVAAVDPGKQGSEQTNRLIMDLATSLAERESASLHVVHAWHMQGENILRSGRAHISELELEQLLLSKEQQHRRQLDELVSNHDLSAADFNARLVKGTAPEVISSMSKKVRADLIVMGTLARSGLPGLIIGNTAEEILRNTQTSIMAVKPDGFASPVTLP